jgi:hypothetical protein
MRVRLPTRDLGSVQTADVSVLEFWPDYEAGPLWTDEGKPVDLAALSIDHGLVERTTAWNAAYSEDKVPIEGSGDEAWLNEGKRLLGEVRSALDDQYQVVVTEPWWGEEPI